MAENVRPIALKTPETIKEAVDWVRAMHQRGLYKERHSRDIVCAIETLARVLDPTGVVLILSNLLRRRPLGLNHPLISTKPNEFKGLQISRAAEASVVSGTCENEGMPQSGGSADRSEIPPSSPSGEDALPAQYENQTRPNGTA